MKTYDYKKVDAFTSKESKGNPAAYLFLGDDELSSEKMLDIGKEHSGFVSEIVFCSNSKKADVKLTYYSSECEVEFCGHGTIATMYDLIKSRRDLYLKKEIAIETNRKGILKVFNYIKEDDAVYITAPKAQHLTSPCNITSIAEALEILESDISTDLPIDFIDAGLRTLIVPIADFNKEIIIFPNEMNLKKFCIDNKIDIILIFSKKASKAEYKAHTRVFAPKFGYLEDTATGSGNSAFANYLLKNHLWTGNPIAVEQGGENIAFNTVKLKMNGNDVLFGGSATVRIEGKYNVY